MRIRNTERRQALAKAQAVARNHEIWRRQTQANANANPLVEFKDCRCLTCDLSDYRRQHYRGG